MFDVENLIIILKKRKWLIIVIAIILSSLMLFLIQPKPPTPAPEITPQDQQPEISPYTGHWPTKTPQEIIAVEDQTKADEKFADWERTTKVNYPWISRIPIRSDKYFAYFELDSGRFIGLVYPAQGEDPEQIKKEVIRVLKEEKGIPTDNFPFIWTVFPPE